MAPANRLDRPLDEVLSLPEGAWAEVIAGWRSTEPARELVRYIDGRVASGVPVYPSHVLRALELTPLEATKVVIVGQDPYHGPGQAQGLAFSVASGVRLPPSLRNIFKEIERDLGLAPPLSGDLTAWARQGVLLLNTTLTVEDGQAASHSKRGWESLTDGIIAAAAEASRSKPMVFMLWGAHAQAKEPLISAHGRRPGGGPASDADGAAAGTSGPLILKANHPSPLSALRGPTPFIGCGHFGLANSYLSRGGGREFQIDWRLR